MNAKHWRRLRKIVQIISFLLFVYLFVQVVYLTGKSFLSDLYYRLNPLIAISAMLAGRTLIAGLLYGGITILLTLVFGRVWCGWICPLGSVLEWLTPKTKKRKKERVKPNENWRRVKYLLLVAIITAAVFGNQTLLIFDPISIVTRSMTTVVWPAVRNIIYGAESFLYQFEFLWDILDGLHYAVILPLFQDIQSVFYVAIPMLVFLLAVIGLNWITGRFWCCYLCPLGGLLGFLSRFALLRREVQEGCNNCGLCSQNCPTDTIDSERNYQSDPAECIVCFQCITDCTQESAAFTWHIPGYRAAQKQSYDPQRRQVLLTMAAAASGVAVAGIEPITRRQPARLLRPPGGRLTDFESMCIRCGECVRVCPTQGLQPALFESGVQNIFTPHLVPRLGCCSYNCRACLEVCPTGAIPPQTLEEKQRTPIGLASINTDRCLPWAYGIVCSICEEMCPLPEKAIKLSQGGKGRGKGAQTDVLKPYVVKDLCIGCGLCEYNCPVGGEAAIQVHTYTEAGGFRG